MVVILEVHLLEGELKVVHRHLDQFLQLAVVMVDAVAEIMILEVLVDLVEEQDLTPALLEQQLTIQDQLNKDFLVGQVLHHLEHLDMVLVVVVVPEALELMVVQQLAELEEQDFKY